MLEPTVHEQLLASPILTNNTNDADLFYIPHYSRMCSGFTPPEERWEELPDYLEKYGHYFTRYSTVDHFMMHSVPNYGDKPADIAIDDSRQPIIGVLDFKWSEMIKSPWTHAKSQILPFITLKSKINPKAKRKIPVFVAMSTNHLAKNSANLRKNLTEIFKKIKNSEFIKISRTSPKSVRDILAVLPTKMGSSDFCIIPPGDAPTSKRLYDAISHLCIPIIVADYMTLPFDGTSINYTECVIQIPSKDIEKIPDLVNNFDKNKIKEMRKKLEIVREMFIWDYKNPPNAGQAFWNFAWNLYYKSEMMKPYRNSEMTGYDNDPPTIFI
ncbi:Exostosin family protein [Trichomonas vaginalis G3]|uniref:Exostosin family protein n=1 Tax=Trichomonas vaginalis (strain ATCC PRA-98 / G3) TaxID=412133 RepID=A2DSP7_TRIV3|nr:macromolecule glycosylation [Trichomonas vaginalis G3]EAY16627.1 Exostosin family protein [Trichomonas vaginalis G3]KAI5533004.1 macromolecule glycosylation [Trichomonas vaginalis G3]|eukprot:XP_001328850.1 Exostosin family protein [Trichomonas vaginalis G3]